MITDVETFVIRIWTPAERDDDLDCYRLRGLAEHIGSGRRKPFVDPRELLEFLGADHRGLPKEDEP
jgi:hypothetical protein